MDEPTPHVNPFATPVATAHPSAPPTTASTAMRVLTLFFGVPMVAFGALIVLATIINVADGSSKDGAAANVSVGLVMGVLPVLAGIQLLRSSRRAHPMRLVGALLLVLGGLIAGGGLVGYFDGTEVDTTATLVMVAFFGALPIAGGIALVAGHWRRRPVLHAPVLDVSTQPRPVDRAPPAPSSEARPPPRSAAPSTNGGTSRDARLKALREPFECAVISESEYEQRRRALTGD